MGRAVPPCGFPVTSITFRVMSCVTSFTLIPLLSTSPDPPFPANPSHPTYPLRKHQPGQESDGQTGSWCLDKAVQPRDARYQKKACPKNLPIPHPKHNSRNRALEHHVQANFSKFWRSSLLIRGIRSLGIVHVKSEEFARCPSGVWSFQSPLEQRVPPSQYSFFCSPHACHMPETKQNVVMSVRTHHKHETGPLSLYNQHNHTLPTF